MLEPAQKNSDARSWSRSLKFEYRLHSPDSKNASVWCERKSMDARASFSRLLPCFICIHCFSPFLSKISIKSLRAPTTCAERLSVKCCLKILNSKQVAL